MGHITRIRTRNQRMILASRPTKLLAEEKGVDLSGIKGTGAKGKITIVDVRNYISSTQTNEEEE